MPLFLYSSLSLVSLSSVLEDERKKKQKKRRKKAGDPRQRLMDLGSFFWIFFFSFFFSRSQQFLFFTRKETDNSVLPIGFPTKKRKGKGAQRTAAETIYIDIYRYIYNIYIDIDIDARTTDRIYHRSQR